MATKDQDYMLDAIYSNTTDQLTIDANDMVVSTTNSTGAWWGIYPPNDTTVPYQPNPPGTWTVPSITISPGNYSWPPASPTWPEDLPNTIGLIFIENDEIKLRNKKGENLVLAKIDESQKTIAVNLIAIIARTVLAESIEKAEQNKEKQ